MGYRIRDATREDCAALRDIYNFYVRTSTATFALVEETLEERLQWFDAHRPNQPVIVADDGGDIAGWASLSTYNQRCGYSSSIENSIYVREDWRGKGVGSALLETLIGRARAHGYHTIVAGVSADQDASLALHRRFGFVEVAHFREVGFKFERFLDVVYLQLMLSRQT